MILSALWACAPASDGVTADGKSIDALATVSGSGLTSDHLDSSATYMASRSLSALSEVGAFIVAGSATLASRADGIIANLPADSRLDAVELERMESSTVFASLFPEEQAAIPHLWDVLLAPTNTRS